MATSKRGSARSNRRASSDDLSAASNDNTRSLFSEGRSRRPSRRSLEANTLSSGPGGNKASDTHNVPASERERTRILAITSSTVIADKYRILSSGDPAVASVEPLGRGGSGVVYLAEQTLYRSAVVRRAIKFYVFRDNIAKMTAHKENGPISATNFTDEIANISTLNHENILKVIEAGMYASPAGYEIPFLITEFIEGFTLQEAIDGRVLDDAIKESPSILIDLILQLSRGVSYLHSRNFYHCDLAPKNIFLRRSGANYQLVVGDLGIGRTIPPGGTKEYAGTFFLAGTREYCPEDVQARLNSDVPIALLSKLQPYWDLFAVAKTAQELVATCERLWRLRPAWFGALKSTLVDVVNRSRIHTIEQLRRRVHWLHPTQHTTWEVPELSDTAPGVHRSLLPIESAALSPRIRHLTHHPAILRLKRVPQLMMGSRIFHGGSHNRYEHTLGTYQNTRRYLVALLEDDEFLAKFSPEYAELALVAAVLSSATRFPIAPIIHELHNKDRSTFPQFSRKHILDELLNVGPTAKDGVTLSEMLECQFPHLNRNQLVQLLTGGRLRQPDHGFRFVTFLLNSSIDARVTDYLRRDSHHLGISRGDPLDLQELLPHIRFRNGQIAVTSAGMTVVEDIVSQRYWLFQRIYWNRPNRGMIAMLRHVLHRLNTTRPKFAERLRQIVLKSSENGILDFLDDEAKKSGLPEVMELCQCLRAIRVDIYDEFFQFNRAEGDANARVICDSFAKLNLGEIDELQNRLSTYLRKELKIERGREHVLVDLPVEYGSMKLGEDINVETRRRELKSLTKLSGIVHGVQTAFIEHTQRLRIFVHPETSKALQADADRVRREMSDILFSSLS